MRLIAAPFVIIMNDDLESSYMQWRVVHRDPTLADARFHNQYASVIASYPRDHYRAVMVEAKTLIHTPSGIVKWGAIYKLSEMPACVRIKRFDVPVGANGRCVNLSPRGVRVYVASLGGKSAKLDDRAFAPIIISKKGKPGSKRNFAPLVIEKTSRSPNRRKM